MPFLFSLRTMLMALIQICAKLLACWRFLRRSKEVSCVPISPNGTNNRQSDHYRNPKK
jgi:hypothetical protein